MKVLSTDMLSRFREFVWEEQTGSQSVWKVYSSLTILILFMIWLYLYWVILLFGASVAFYVQHQEYLYFRDGKPRLSARLSN